MVDMMLKRKKYKSKLSDKFLELRMSPKLIEQLTENARFIIESIRYAERNIMSLCVKQGKMPRKEFIQLFPGNEVNTEWLKTCHTRRQNHRTQY